MELNESFWKEAALKIENLFINPIKLKNEDLLQEVKEDLKTLSPSNILPPKFNSKYSELSNKYTNYKPEIILILKGSQKLSRNKRCIDRTPSPIFSLKSRSPEIFQDFEQSLEIFGQRAGFYKLPRIINPIKLKNFIIRVREKYESLFKQLKDTDGVIRLEGILDYLTRSTNMKRCSPSVKFNSRSESMMRRGRFSKLEKEYTSFVQEQGKRLMVIGKKDLFDPLTEGFISQYNFFGIIGIFEYSCAGIEGGSKSKIDLTSFKHIRFLNIQVNQLKSLYFKYKQSALLEKQALVKLFESIKRLDNCLDEIFTVIDLKKSANFGQFLSIIPLFLENYEEIMKNLD